MLYPAPLPPEAFPGKQTGLDPRAGGAACSIDRHLGVAHGTVPGISPQPGRKYFPHGRGRLAGLRLQHCFSRAHPRGHPNLEQVQGGSLLLQRHPRAGRLRLPPRRQAWITTLQEGGVHCRFISTGKFRFMEIARELRGIADLDELEEGVCGRRVKRPW